MLKKLLSFVGIGQPKESPKTAAPKKPKAKPKVESTRIGELGEHKINIQLDQLPKDCKYISDVMITNAKSRSGYSQIDHVVISPYGIFVIETKNYNGEIEGSREDKQWSVSNRFKMYNPLKQNYGHIKALETLLSAHSNLRFISMISFTMRCRFSIDPELRKIESDELIVYDVELSEFISRKVNRIKATTTASPLTAGEIEHIHESIVKANIIDPALRALHIQGAKGNRNSNNSS